MGKAKEVGEQFGLDGRAAAILAETEARAEKMGIVELENLMGEARQPGYQGHAPTTLLLLQEMLDIRCGRVEPSPEAQLQVAVEADAAAAAWREKDLRRRDIVRRMHRAGIDNVPLATLQAELDAIDAPPKKE